jgi:hypothetical protein
MLVKAWRLLTIMLTALSLGPALRRELIASIWPRYREARWDDKQRILDEFTAATGYHRK